MAGGRCCACNGPNAVCKSCSCVKSELPCSFCRPGAASSCHNPFGVPPASQRSASPSPRGPSSSPADSLVAPTPSPVSAIPSSSDLPSFEAICRLSVPLLLHIPKGARNSWSGVLSSVIESIIARPSDLEAWAKLFMLPKCTLFLVLDVT